MRHYIILGVGKTSMVVRYVGKMFNQHVSPTIGASFFTCRLNVQDTRVKLQVYLLHAYM
jgi:Ras-related protein Rab-21